MKLLIVTDGTRAGTTVLDGDEDEQLDPTFARVVDVDRNEDDGRIEILIELPELDQD